MPLRIIFMGTPEFSVPSLVELIAQGHEIVGVYTQPPRPAGRRGLELKKSPVHEKAEEFGLTVFTPENFKDESDREHFASLDADVAIVIAYGLILPIDILNAPRLGCYNGHASLLPRWRGAAPIQRAIMAGDKQAGTMVMKMEEGLDTGPVALSEICEITPQMTAGDLHDALSSMTADLMVRAMSELERGSLELTPQAQEGVLYASKIEKTETRINWEKPSQVVHNHIMGLSPFPGSWCEMKLSGKMVRVKVLMSYVSSKEGNAGKMLNDDLTIGCAQGSVKLIRLQKAGGKPQDAQEFLRGNKVEAIN